MTTYGTVPTSSSSSPPAPPLSSNPIEYISRAKERGFSAYEARRPWKELYEPSAFSLPPSLGEAYLRIRSNIAYFAMNYAIVVLIVVFVSLLWHPWSLIVFLVCLVAWTFLYFLREGPLYIAGRQIVDSVILLGLSGVTIVLLLLTNATANILISLVIGVVVVVAHAAFRKEADNAEEETAVLVGGRWP